ncbi:hypothetical protein AB0M97_16175 [Streptomyces sp. NPDC051207]|uniref:hypothetical protein n=1 Tax=Streptomyces sp. NPDC051207 TaxID=3154641 RepID=UPI003438FEBA
MKQEIAFMVNRYVVTEAGPDGSDGEVVAFAQQKRMALKEQVTFYTDETKKQVLFGFRARNVLDLKSGYDVTDAAGGTIGFFQKKFAASLVRSTWLMRQGDGMELTGRERSQAVAVLRRAWDVLPLVDALPFAWPYHFDFTADGDSPVMSVDKKFGLRDRYVVHIASPDLDRRLAIAQAVALDALQSR